MLLLHCPYQIDVKKEVTKDTVVVNGKSHSVDLVALICYHKLRKKCPGILLICNLFIFHL